MWQNPPNTLQLLATDAHVWRVPLQQSDDALEALLAVLDADERARADRFRFPKDRRHYIAARGTLRLLLSRYLAMPVAKIAFDYNEYGKPALAPELTSLDLRFNLSHSGDMALYAVTLAREVGVDIEWTGRRLDQPEQIAERYFSQAERAALRNLPETQKRQGFFNAWTRKEAYIKARGKGLYLALDEFDVRLDPAQPAQLLATRDDPAQASRWQMQALDPGAGYVAALVVEGGGWQAYCYNWCV
ncbi:4'-phosphopantetheinyl transferase [Candidatus Moduliflexus flocculans]|uniref:4'-phosphopantetheinyl transferase n=1 Tax=Candidatus Moduliflexus flocculans TaxID=1499966 RepID=A0A081BMS5_9BACT|nr:4'-phosphopantetheinyl transferase [Candidatus Moduliflexus flocculans]